MRIMLLLCSAFLASAITTKAQTVVPFLKKNGKYILVDAATNKPIATNTREFDEATELEGGFWQLCNDGNCALYNKFGKELMKPKKLIFREKLQGSFFKTFQATGADAITGLYGIVDTLGVELAPTQYQYLWNFSEGFIGFSRSNGKSGFIDKKGKIVIDGIVGNVYSFSNGFAKVETSLANNTKQYFYIDKTGKAILKPSIKNIEWYDDFFEGLASFKQKSTDLVGLIDKTGKVVLHPKFQEISYFTNGLAVAKLNNKCGFINKTGNFVIANQYDEAKKFENGLAIVKKAGLYGAIDAKGNEIVPLKYEELNEFSDGILILNNKENFDFYNTKGNLIFSAIVADEDNLKCFSYGYALITLPTETILIDKNGKQTRIPSAANDGFIAKTPNYVEARYVGGSEFKNYFISVNGKEYKEK